MQSISLTNSKFHLCAIPEKAIFSPCLAKERLRNLISSENIFKITEIISFSLYNILECARIYFWALFIKIVQIKLLCQLSLVMHVEPILATKKCFFFKVGFDVLMMFCNHFNWMGIVFCKVIHIVIKRVFRKVWYISLGGFGNIYISVHWNKPFQLNS